MNNQLANACLEGNKQLVELLISKESRITTGVRMDFRRGLANACYGGHKEIIELMIKKGALNFNEGLRQACEGKHKNIVELMIEKGASNFYEGLQSACSGGSEPIVKLMISKGGDNFDDGLRAACFGGHLKIVKLMLNKGADPNEGLPRACYYGNQKIVEYLVSKGANDFNQGLLHLYHGITGYTTGPMDPNQVKYKNILKLLIINGKDKIDINNCLYELELDFDDIYYLLQSGVTQFGKFSKIADKCKKWKIEFQNTVNELFIKDIANIIIDF